MSSEMYGIELKGHTKQYAKRMRKTWNTYKARENLLRSRGVVTCIQCGQRHESKKTDLRDRGWQKARIMRCNTGRWICPWCLAANKNLVWNAEKGMAESLEVIEKRKQAELRRKEGEDVQASECDNKL